MIVNICYNNSCVNLVKAINDFKNITINSFNEDLYNEKKKSYKIKGGFSARMTPFVLITSDNKEYIKAFYSENKECTIDNVLNYLNTFNNESTSN